jgi:hypothetical protein
MHADTDSLKNSLCFRGHYRLPGLVAVVIGVYRRSSAVPTPLLLLSFLSPI